jgi:hypothetical protein
MTPRMRRVAGSYRCACGRLTVCAPTAKAAWKMWHHYDRMLRAGGKVTPA